MFKERKLDKLVMAGIISGEQKQQILDFDNHSKGQRIAHMLYLLGAFAIGVGVISVVAANWKNIGDAFKLFVMFALLFGGAWKVFDWQQKGLNDRAEKMMIVLFLLVGAAIGLIIQISNKHCSHKKRNRFNTIP